MLDRFAKKSGYTIGRLYVDGEYFSNTLEDVDRGLRQGQTEEYIRSVKVKGQTAIPMGRYQITLAVRSPRFGARAAYQFCGGKLPRLIDVPGFDGVLIHCLTPDTEVLTDMGWVNMERFKELNPTKCFSYNTETGLIELVDINFYVENDYDGTLYCNNGRRINYEVTDEHNMWVGNPDRKHNWHYGFRKAKDLLITNRFVTSANKAIGWDIAPEQKVLYRLIMATQADGYILNWSKTASQVKFHFKKERKISRMKSLLEDIEQPYGLSVHKDGSTSIVLNNKLSETITEIMNPERNITNTKELPLELLSLRSEDIKDLLLEYLFWDGRYENYLRNNLNMIIVSSNMRTLDILQAMATLCGMRSYIKNSHSPNCNEIVLYENQSTVTPESDTYGTRPYKGKVWCLNNDNHTLIIRKNKRTMVVGNCGNTAKDTEGCILVGENKQAGRVLNSLATLRKLYDKMKGADEIWITIK